MEEMNEMNNEVLDVNEEQTSVQTVEDGMDITSLAVLGLGVSLGITAYTFVDRVVVPGTKAVAKAIAGKFKKKDKKTEEKIIEIREGVVEVDLPDEIVDKE